MLFLKLWLSYRNLLNLGGYMFGTINNSNIGLNFKVLNVWHKINYLNLQIEINLAWHELMPIKNNINTIPYYTQNLRIIVTVSLYYYI